MNRFLLAFALTFGAAGVASAQNVSTSAQQGSNNGATVNQTGMNTSDIIQGNAPTDADNSATVKQNGTNASDIDQTGSMNLGVVEQLGAGNSADIDQSGNNNEGRIYQGAITGFPPPGTSTGSIATVVQSGNNNRDLSLGFDGSIIAQGTESGTATGGVTADVIQSGNNGGVTVNQGNNGDAIGSDTDVTQQGDNNAAEVFQGVAGGSESKNDVATVNQTGSALTNYNNQAFIRQGYLGPDSENSDATITQSGHDGQARVFQSGLNQSGEIEQGAGANGAVARIDQNTGSNNSGADAGSFIGQDGAVVSQAKAGGQAILMTGVINQTGSNGGVLISQGDGDGSPQSLTFSYAFGGSAVVNQAGTNNAAFATQAFYGTSRSDQAFIDQIGANSRAAVYQGFGNGDDSESNIGRVTQNAGTGNRGQITQGSAFDTGGNNDALDNDAEITQTGSTNQGRINQGTDVTANTGGAYAFNNDATMTQDGDNNNGRINQGIDGAEARNSIATLMQTGDGHTGTINQTGNLNTANVTQD